MEEKDLVHRFTYHAPKGEMPFRRRIREEALELANTINVYCPDGREKSLAITSLEEVVMWANAAIARGG